MNKRIQVSNIEGEYGILFLRTYWCCKNNHTDNSCAGVSVCVCACMYVCMYVYKHQSPIVLGTVMWEQAEGQLSITSKIWLSVKEPAVNTHTATHTHKLPSETPVQLSMLLTLNNQVWQARSLLVPAGEKRQKTLRKRPSTHPHWGHRSLSLSLSDIHTSSLGMHTGLWSQFLTV